MTSILDQTEPENVATTITAQVDPQKDYYTELVGEGKKFKDAQALARSVAEKDSVFIPQLQLELRKAREDIVRLSERAQVNQRLETIQELLARKPEAPVPQANQPSEPVSPDLSDERFNALLDARDQKRSREDNIKEAQKILKNAFGTEVKTKVEDMATKLGVGIEFLNGVAADKPAVFYELMGISPDGVKHAAPGPTLDGVTFAPPRNRVNSDSFKPNLTSDRTETYYENMRLSEPKKYHTRDMQWQEHNDAIRLGEAFFDKPAR